jgi:DNA-binding PadR family transcriptional regulator
MRTRGFGGPGRGGRGPRARRGDVRAAVLALLADRPMHGYEMIKEIEERSEGAWTPSAGSIYPMLQLLEDEGAVRSSERDGKRVFEVTDAGRAEAARRVEEAGGTPWELAGSDDDRIGDLRGAMRQLFVATKQVMLMNDRDRMDRTTEILKRARKDIYTLLAED